MSSLSEPQKIFEIPSLTSDLVNVVLVPSSDSVEGIVKGFQESTTHVYSDPWFRPS